MRLLLSYKEGIELRLPGLTLQAEPPVPTPRPLSRSQFSLSLLLLSPLSVLSPSPLSFFKNACLTCSRGSS